MFWLLTVKMPHRCILLQGCSFQPLAKIFLKQKQVNSLGSLAVKIDRKPFILQKTVLSVIKAFLTLTIQRLPVCEFRCNSFRNPFKRRNQVSIGVPGRIYSDSALIYVSVVDHGLCDLIWFTIDLVLRDQSRTNILKLRENTSGNAVRLLSRVLLCTHMSGESVLAIHRTQYLFQKCEN